MTTIIENDSVNLEGAAVQPSSPNAGRYKLYIDNTGTIYTVDSAGTAVPVTFGMTWNATDQTVDLPLNANVTLQLGQEFFFLGRNNEGSAITNGQVVKTSGSTGTRVTMDLAQADSVANAGFIGLVTEPSIANNAEGFSTIAGKVRGIDTSMWTEGDVLYLSTTTPGALTNVKPAWPALAAMVARVERSHPSEGILLVGAYETAAGAYEKAVDAAAAVSTLSSYENVIVVDAGGNGDYETFNAAYTAEGGGKTYYIFGETTEPGQTNISQACTLDGGGTIGGIVNVGATSVFIRGGVTISSVLIVSGVSLATAVTIESGTCLSGISVLAPSAAVTLTLMAGATILNTGSGVKLEGASSAPSLIALDFRNGSVIESSAGIGVEIEDSGFGGTTLNVADSKLYGATIIGASNSITSASSISPAIYGCLLGGALSNVTLPGGVDGNVTLP